MGTLLTVACMPNILYTTASASEEFAGGNNTINYDGDFSTTSYINSNGIEFDLDGYGGYDNNQVIGAKVSVHYTTNETIIQTAKGLSGGDLTNYLHNNLTSFDDMTYGGPWGISLNSFYVYDGGTGGAETYICNWYGTGNNVPVWIQNTGTGIQFRLNNLHQATGPIGIGTTLGNALYNESVWQISASQRWFVAASSGGGYSESGAGSLPGAVHDAIIQASMQLTNRTGESAIPQGAYMLWYVEPLIAMDVYDPTGVSRQVAMTPAMLAYYLDNSSRLGLKTTGLSGIGSDGRSIAESIVLCTSTDGLSGNASYSYPFTDVDYGSMLSSVNNQSYGAYAVPIEPEEVVSHDTLPEIPSIPVFKETESGIEYMGLSSTVPSNVWSDISEVLNYAMNNTNSVSNTNALYQNSRIQTSVNKMKQYSDNAISANGNYSDNYAVAYGNLWNNICGYYSSQGIEFGDASATVPSRSSSHQPSSVTDVLGSGVGPYRTNTPMGSTGSDLMLSYENLSVYKLSGATSIVDTSATAKTSLGTLQAEGAQSISVADVLKNPYAYSIVIKSSTMIDSTAYPEPPNIVVWDEDTDKTWEASISSSDWQWYLSGLHYARNDGGSNVANLESANLARTAAEYLQTHTMSDYNTWRVNLHQYETELASIKSFQNALGSAVSELNGYLTSSFYTETNPPIYIPYSGNVIECRNSALSAFVNYASYGMFNLTSSSTFAQTDIFTAVPSYKTLTSKGTMLNWYDTYKAYMYANYYNSTMDSRVYCSSISLYLNSGGAVGGNRIFPQYNYSNYLNSDPNTWIPNYTMPRSSYDHLNTLSSTSALQCQLDHMCCTYVDIQCKAYNDLLTNYVPATITALESAITELTTKINEYDAMVEQFNTNYQKTVEDMVTHMENSGYSLVESSTIDGQIHNNVTDRLSIRNGNPAFAEMVQSFKFPTWVLTTDNNPIQVNAGEMVSKDANGNVNVYTAYKDGEIYDLDSIGNPLKGTLDDLYNDGRNNLNFKYRVVYTGSPTTAMTTDSIKNYANGDCYTSLGYAKVFDAPYSYGIIVNSLTKDLTTTTIREWQLTEYMKKTELDDSSIWTGWGGGTPSFLITNTPYHSTITGTRRGEGEISWISQKITGGSAPGLVDTSVLTSGGGRTYLGEGTSIYNTPTDTGKYSWTPGSYTDTALYSIVNSWGNLGGGTNSGTIEILTATITTQVYTPTANSGAVVAGDTYFRYRHDDPDTDNSSTNEGGTDISVWLNGGSIDIFTAFPMMVSSGVDETLGEDPHPTKLDGGLRTLNIGDWGASVNGYLPDWCWSDKVHSLNTPYNVRLSYHAGTKIETTFSTDKEDTDAMQADIVAGENVIPFLKAGQTFTGEIADNSLVLEGYANVQANGTFVANNNLTFKTKDEFLNYMNGIKDAIVANAKMEVISTMNGLTFSTSGSDVVNGDSYTVDHTKTTKVDNAAGVIFSDAQLAESVDVSTLTNNAEVYQHNGLRHPAVIPGFSYNSIGTYDAIGGPAGFGTLGSNTQDAYNSLLNTNKGESEWYYEYSQALGIVYYKAVIKFPTVNYTATISRYESDFNTDADQYVKDQHSDLQTAWSSFGYNTYLTKTDGKNAGEYVNVVATAIDLSDALAASPALSQVLTQDTNGDGTVETVSKILGKQTPIHIRGSVYDNT